MIRMQTVQTPHGADSGGEIGGWLLLFILWLGVIGPLYSLGLNGFFVMRWRAMYPEAAGYYVSWNFWCFIAAREGSRMLAATVMVARRSADAVWFAVFVMWLSGPVLVTGTWLLSETVIMPSALVRSTAIAAAATIYLLRSERVRAIYRFSLAPDLPAQKTAGG